jgi:hypothetical protein
MNGMFLLLCHRVWLGLGRVFEKAAVNAQARPNYRETKVRV